MTSAVRDSYRRWAPVDEVPRTPFRLTDSDREQPSTYVIELDLSGVRYVYGFVADDHAVREEWLHSYPRGRRRILFEREGKSLELGESLGPKRAKVDVLVELTRSNALFLSLAAQVGLTELMPVYSWFVAGGIEWSNPGERLSTPSGLESLISFLKNENNSMERTLRFLQAADIGIDEIVVDNESPLLASNESKIEVHLAFWLSSHRIPEDWLNSTVRFRHGEGPLFALDDESAGTRSWLSLLPQVLTVFDAGGLLIIDEIDTSLHPSLSALLIRQFQSPDTNPADAQLLFTTHDATLLSNSFGDEVLARDQVWFVEKDNAGASRLYPLTDFHPRNGENRERRYLTGSYGAVPVIGLRELTDRPVRQKSDRMSHTSRTAKAAGE